MRFYVETYGCTSNFGNSHDLKTALISLGHLPSAIEEADVIIVNTCAVTEKTERNMQKRLRQLEGERLIIAGCLPAALPESVEGISYGRKMALLNRSAAAEIAAFYRSGFSDKTPKCNLHGSILKNYSAPDSLCSVINIAEGCLGRCSYCLVRRARGELISVDPEVIVEEARSRIGSGALELQIAAQDTAAYGLDIGTSLPELLNRITGIPGRFMVRVGMMNPNSAKPIQNELAEAFRSPKVYKFLHMPVQSGSDEVLKRMCRGYLSEDYIEIVRLFREKLPEPSFATDVITGFPGETEIDFARTLKLIELTRPVKVNITRYSSRPKTSSFELYDMPDRIKKGRSRTLTKLWQDIAGEENSLYQGEVLKVLVTERGRGDTMKARTSNYTGVVIEGLPPIGSQKVVKIVRSGPFYLTGTIVSFPV
jgi:threonylcarbamoyladenosine tRNA methylthiotransferase CDKAL1